VYASSATDEQVGFSESGLFEKNTKNVSVRGCQGADK
jgi:hypothetical protein